MYTHTDVKDVWSPFFGQTKKYMNDFKKYAFINKKDESVPDDYIQVIYDDKLPYIERLLHCLNQIDDEFIIFHHEDMFLYDKPDFERIFKYLKRLDKNYFFIKLIRGGKGTGMSDEEFPELKKITKDFEYIFAIQPTIWKREAFIRLLENTKANSIWDFEIKAQKTCRDLNILGYYVDDNGKQRGRLHWDSKVYPYIATAVVKGKWNTKEYPEEMGEISRAYNIDYKKRGVNG